MVFNLIQTQLVRTIDRLMLRKIVAIRQQLVTASGLSADKRAMCIVFPFTRNYNEPYCNYIREIMEAII
jgi:hypothetical protein